MLDIVKLTKLGTFSVVFEERPDGGLRVYSDDVPGFFLSHPDRDAVLRDVAPALETIIGSLVGGAVRVVPGPRERDVSLSAQSPRITRDYEAKAAA
jgi:hypothetical protein